MKNFLIIGLCSLIFSALSPAYAIRCITIGDTEESGVVGKLTNQYMDKGSADEESERLAFEALRELAYQKDVYLDIYYNLILAGNGDDNDKLKLFEYQEQALAQNSTDIKLIERLAFCYDNGIGTQKDEAKAKSLRLEIEDILKDKDADLIYNEYMELTRSYMTSKRFFYRIYSPEMNEYYKAKAENARLEKELASFEKEFADFSEADKALIYEFREIFKLFCDENGKAIKHNKLPPELKEQLADFYEKAIAAESHSMALMAKYAVIYMNYSLGLDSLHFRVFSLPYFLRASEYCPELYAVLAYCYDYGRACRGDKKIAADLYLKQALYIEHSYSKKTAFDKAFKLYTELGEYDTLKFIIEKREEALGASIADDLDKVRFYLMESQHKDVDYARVLIAKIKEGIENQEECYITLFGFSSDFNCLELGELQFWAAQKFYKRDINNPFGFIYHRILVNGYLDGVYCEKDTQKAMDILIDLANKNKNNFNSFIIDEFAQLMLDVENKDETLFRETLETLLELNNSFIPNLMKALAIDKGFAYEKDITQRDFYIEKLANTNALYYLTKNYTMLSPSDSLLEKVLELNPKASDTNKMIAHIRLGNAEEALKYANNYDSTHIEKDYHYANAVHLILKDEAPEDTAKRYFRPAGRGQGLIYASMQYEGVGVERDKEKAFEGFKKTSDLWHKDMGNDARVWLWKYYTENDQAHLAQALIDPKTQGMTLYNSRLLLSAAKNFSDNLNLPVVTRTFNLTPSEEYAKYFLELAEERYFSNYAMDLLAIYGKDPKLANLEKKLEIRQKAKTILNSPQPTRREAPNYPAPEKIEKK